MYGSSPRDPAMFTEDTGAKVLPRSGWGKDSVEVEGYVRGFSRRRPDVDVVMLRFANIIGPAIRTALTDYFSLPVVPTVAIVSVTTCIASILRECVRDGRCTGQDHEQQRRDRDDDDSRAHTHAESSS